MNNHARSTLTWPVRNCFHIKTLASGLSRVLLNIQTSSYARHGRCSGHEVDVRQSRGEESQIKGELLLITVV